MATQDLVSSRIVAPLSLSCTNVTESPEEYLEENVFPILMEGMEEMLQVATKTEVSRALGVG